ncbi:MAG TPA: 4-hydroxy-tetrahydrodipicolinate reductase [Gammaproteobacteria bacterium]|nr:4-hydroxy-tetrahydrodipicolinate reductase [Gammaproteobacteria bacterium]
MLKIAITGASGRMGNALIHALHNADDCTLSGALVRNESSLLGKDIGIHAGLDALGIAFSNDLQALVDDADAIIDFSTPELALRTAVTCARSSKPFVCGTTGLSDEEKAALVQAAQSTPIVHAANMSIGVNLTLQLVQTAARVLGDDYDIEITEAHHRHKKDAPSGTALALGEAAAQARNQQLAECAVYDRTGERQLGQIGFSVIRAGEIIGEHEVLFASANEQITIGHKAQNRQNFAQGAIRAAHWLNGKPPALYSMQDVLNLNGG